MSEVFFNGSKGKIIVNRDFMQMRRQHLDIYGDTTGIGGNYLWERNNVRLLVIHPFLDFLRRNKRKGMKPEEQAKLHVSNFYVKYDEIQGVVSDRKHKEFHIMTEKEQIKVFFRIAGQYEEFKDFLTEKLGDKFHTRDDVEIIDSVYIENKN